MSEIVSTAPQEEVVAPPATPAAEVAPVAAIPAGDAPATTADKPVVAVAKTPAEIEREAMQKGFERRLGKEVKRRAEAQALAEFYEKQARDLQRPAQAPDHTKPDIAQFTTNEDYAAAMEKWATDKFTRDHQQRQHAESAQAEQRHLAESWNRNALRGEEKYADWDEVVPELGQPVTPADKALMLAENGHDIIYHLRKNPAELTAILQMHPALAAGEIGALSARLKAAPVKPPPVSKAPPPIEPVGAGNTVAHKALSEIDDFDEFTKRRKEQIKKRR